MPRPRDLDKIPYTSDLRDALAQPGCALCRVVEQAANAYVVSMLWEMVNDPRNQEPLQAARGYCHRHGWMLVRGGAALGITILMKSVLDTLLETVDRHAANGGGSPLRQLRQALNLPGKGTSPKLVAELLPQAECPVCIGMRPVEQGYVATLAAGLTGPNSLEEAFRESEGLCLSHFIRTLEQVKPGAPLNTLVALQRQIWQNLNDEMAEFIRKNDYRFTHEPIGKEGDAWRRGLSVTSGPPPKEPGQDQPGLTSGLK